MNSIILFKSFEQFENANSWQCYFVVFPQPESERDSPHKGRAYSLCGICTSTAVAE